MRTHIEFRSDAFPAESGEEEKINPGRWGAALSRYLQQEKFFRKIDTTARVEVVADALESALRKHPGIRDLHWWPDSKRART